MKMKKLLYLTPLLILTACGTTITQKEAILSTDQATIQVGPYPDNYKNLINSNGTKNEEVLFEPVKYVTNNEQYGWLVCTNNTNNNIILYLINKNNIIVKVNTEQDFKAKTTCNHYISKNNEILANQKEQMRLNESNLELEAKNQLKLIENDSNKDYLFGSYPNNPMPIIKKYLDNVLFDEESARYKDISVNKTYRIQNGKIIWCYAVILQINAKNRMGAYVGYKYSAFYFKDGKLIDQFVH